MTPSFPWDFIFTISNTFLLSQATIVTTRDVHFVTVIFIFVINTSSVSLSPVRASDSNATVLSHCLLSLSKSALYSFLIRDSVCDVIYYIICQSPKVIVTVTEGIWNFVYTFTDVCVRLPVSLCSGTTPFYRPSSFGDFIYDLS